MHASALKSYPDLVTETANGMARLTRNRPDRRKALSKDLVAHLESVLGAVAADPSIRVVIIAANGPVFCAGHDLSEMVGRHEDEYRSIFDLMFNAVC